MRRDIECPICGSVDGLFEETEPHLTREETMRAALLEIKKVALTVRPEGVPAGLAHIVRLCIDALEQNGS